MIKVDKSGVLKQLKHECILEWIALTDGALANSLCGGEFMGIEGRAVLERVLAPISISALPLNHR